MERGSWNAEVVLSSNLEIFSFCRAGNKTIFEPQPPNLQPRNITPSYRVTRKSTQRQSKHWTWTKANGLGRQGHHKYPAMNIYPFNNIQRTSNHRLSRPQTNNPFITFESARAIEHLAQAVQKSTTTSNTTEGGYGGGDIRVGNRHKSRRLRQFGNQ